MDNTHGMSFYFKAGRIRFRNQLIYDLGRPEYVHLFVDVKKKCVYVKACEKDYDAFKLYYLEEAGDQNFYIRAKLLLEFFVKLLGIEYGNTSLRFKGEIIDEGTAVISLTEYEEI